MNKDLTYIYIDLIDKEIKRQKVRLDEIMFLREEPTVHAKGKGFIEGLEQAKFEILNAHKKHLERSDK